MRAYEIQLFKNQKWEFDSYINDHDTALSEADRLLASRRYEGVRVIEEEYDPDTNQSRCNIIYSKTPSVSRYSRSNVRRGPARDVPPRRRTTQRRRRTGAKRKKRSRAAASRKLSRTTRGNNGEKRAPMGTASLMWLGLIIVMSGIAALIGLQEMAGMM